MKDHRFITVERILKTGVVNFLRNIWISIAAIAMITITLTILIFAIVANATFANSITDLTSRIDVSVYLKDSVTEQQSNQLIADLKKVENVKSIEYVSKEQAFDIYKELNKDKPLLLEMISSNTFCSFEVSSGDSEFIFLSLAKPAFSSTRTTLFLPMPKI